MAIETTCPGCACKLRVGDEHAGKTARCPTCKTLYTVPKASGGLSAESATPASSTSTPNSSRPASPQPDSVGSAYATGAHAPSQRVVQVWRLKAEDGQVYGPVGKGDLDHWVAQGRVTPNAEVQQDGDAFWQRASTVYPELAMAQDAAQNPFADLGPTGSSNPYAPSQSHGGVRRSWPENHRGGLILTLGLLGWILGCPILGPVSLVMGMNDIRKMNEGTMDPRGKGLTTAGMVLGGIYTLIMVGLALIMVIAAVFGN